MVGGIATQTVRLLARLVRALAAGARASRAERRLHELDDRMLRDMGIDRGQIGHVVRRSLPPGATARPVPVVLAGGVWQRN